MMTPLLRLLLFAATLGGPVQEAPKGRPVPASAPVTAPPSARWSELLDSFHAAMPSDPAALRDPTVRAAVAPRVTPVLLALVREARLRGGTDGMTFETYALVVGAEPLRREVIARALADEPAARAALAAAAVITADDAAARVVALDALRAHLNAPSAEQVACVRAAFIAGALTGPEARALARAAAQGPLVPELLWAAERWERDARRRIGTPFTFTSETLGGEAWSSEAARGRVLVVDLWATWCGPCVRALPALAALRRTHGRDALVVVGASCDRELEPLQRFIAQHADYDWVQLIGPELRRAPEGGAGWHPLARELGVEAIPCMVVIDRAGVLRAVGPPEAVLGVVEALLVQ